MSETLKLRRTLRCPHCGNTEGKVTLESMADVTYRSRVYAEVDLTDDMGVDDKGEERVKRDKYLLDKRYFPTFRYEDTTDTGDVVDHGDFDLDDPELMAFCFHCQGDVTDEFRALLDKLHPRERVTT